MTKDFLTLYRMNRQWVLECLQYIEDNNKSLAKQGIGNADGNVYGQDLPYSLMAALATMELVDALRDKK